MTRPLTTEERIALEVLAEAGPDGLDDEEWRARYEARLASSRHSNTGDVMDDRVTLVRDEMTWELCEIAPGEEGQRQLDTALRDARMRRDPPRSVPREWWERYVAARTAFNAMERELSDFPEFRVTWHARLRLAGVVVREDEVRFPPAGAYSAP